MEKRFSHVDNKGNPGMVDVGQKETTERKAVASCIVILPPAIKDLIREKEIPGKKGPVFQTAILAGVMAAKKTADLIPLCHPLALTVCNIDITLNESQNVVIVSEVKTRAQTGVEMEALTAASVAALTVYDMCKAISHNIQIGPLQLEAKSGGKHDFSRE